MACALKVTCFASLVSEPAQLFFGMGHDQRGHYREWLRMPLQVIHQKSIGGLCRHPAVRARFCIEMPDPSRRSGIALQVDRMQSGHRSGRVDSQMLPLHASIESTNPPMVMPAEVIVSNTKAKNLNCGTCGDTSSA